MKIALSVLYLFIASIAILFAMMGNRSEGGFTYWLGYYTIRALVWAAIGTILLFITRRVWRYFALKREWKESPQSGQHKD